MNHRPIGMDEATRRFDVRTHLFGARPGMTLLLVEGDAHVESLNLNGSVDGAYGYIVDGDLHVQGRLESSDDRVMALLVTGSVHAGLVFSSGADTAILGNLNASHGVVGHYNHGYLIVSGRIETPWMINSNHHIAWGELKATAVDLYSGQLRPPYTHGTHDLAEGLYDPEYEEVDFARLLDLVSHGRPFLKA